MLPDGIALIKTIVSISMIVLLVTGLANEIETISHDHQSQINKANMAYFFEVPKLK